MSLQIGTALRDGLFKVASRAGAILIAAYLVANVVYMVAFNSAMGAYFAQNDIPAGETFALSLDLPLGVGVALVTLCFVAMVYLSVVAMRTFVADERETVRSDHLTGGVAFAIVNLLVGGIVYSVLVTIGFVLLVVPGIFLMVALTFMQLYIAVENDNFVTAMRRSWNLTEGSRIPLFLLGLIVVGIGFAVGIVFGIGAVVGTFAGIDQAIISLLQIVVIAPVSLFSLAVLASAFNQLRGESGEFDGGSTTADAPSTAV